MDLTLPEELETLRRSVRGFVDVHLRPLEREVESSGKSDPATMARLRKLAVAQGLYAHNLPPGMGGGGLSMLGQVVIAEELGRTSMALAEAVGYLPEMLTFARPDQREWFLEPLVSGEKYSCYAVTEPDAGSDIGAIRTRARRTADGWILNGTKQFISAVDIADFVMVLAVTNPEGPLKERFTVFIVERDHPGFKYTRSMRTMGWHGIDFCAFVLDDCRVGDDHVLGEVNGGFEVIIDSINKTRVQLGGKYVGMAGELMRLAIDYAKTRSTFGKKLGDHQAIAFSLADSDCEFEAARLLLYSAADAIDSGRSDARIAASRIKLYGSEMVGRIADRTVQIFGAAGYVTDLPIERMYRDARGFRIGEGSSEMQRIQIARHLLR